MTKNFRALIIVLSISSPLILLIIGTLTVKSDDAGVALGLILTFILGTPLIAILGMITSFLTRKSTNAQILSLLGYAIPALLIVTNALIQTYFTS